MGVARELSGYTDGEAILRRNGEKNSKRNECPKKSLFQDVQKEV